MANRQKPNKTTAADAVLDDDDDYTTAPVEEIPRRGARSSSAFTTTSTAPSAKSEKSEAKPKRNFTVMIDEDLHQRFQFLSKISGKSMNAMIVEDIAKRVKRKRDVLDTIIDAIGDE
jgi:predicted HicB family RNase H-like nuclease